MRQHHHDSVQTAVGCVVLGAYGDDIIRGGPFLTGLRLGLTLAERNRDAGARVLASIREASDQLPDAEAAEEETLGAALHIAAAGPV